MSRFDLSPAGCVTCRLALILHEKKVPWGAAVRINRGRNRSTPPGGPWGQQNTAPAPPRLPAAPPAAPQNNKQRSALLVTVNSGTLHLWKSLDFRAHIWKGVK